MTTDASFWISTSIAVVGFLWGAGVTVYTFFRSNNKDYAAEVQRNSDKNAQAIINNAAKMEEKMDLLDNSLTTHILSDTEIQVKMSTDISYIKENIFEKLDVIADKINKAG